MAFRPTYEIAANARNKKAPEEIGGFLLEVSVSQIRVAIRFTISRWRLDPSSANPKKTPATLPIDKMQNINGVTDIPKIARDRSSTPIKGVCTGTGAMSGSGASSRSDRTPSMTTISDISPIVRSPSAIAFSALLSELLVARRFRLLGCFALAVLSIGWSSWSPRHHRVARWKNGGDWLPQEGQTRACSSGGLCSLSIDRRQWHYPIFRSARRVITNEPLLAR